MLHRCRKFVFVIVAAILMAPPIIGVMWPNSGTDPSLPSLSFPRRTDEWKWLPLIIEAHLRRDLGLRQAMIFAHAGILHAFAVSSGRVLIGNEGRMFLRDDLMLEQSAGLIVRKPRIVETADLLANVRDILASRGIPFVFASPPNSATIYPDFLPKWARQRHPPTEYDLMLEALGARGILAVDLRPPLNAMRQNGEAAYRKYDSHWTPRGAVVAYNAFVAAANHGDWQLDPASILDPLTPVQGGDLADRLGTASLSTEVIEPIPREIGEHQHLPGPVLVGKSKHAHGGTIMVIGDSFTFVFFSLPLLVHVAQVVWVHHQFCGFDWRRIDEFHPNEVWWMPTERLVLCAPGVRPIGMPTLRGG